jgi:hypothetical protein
MSKATLFSCALFLATLTAGSVSAQDRMPYAPAGRFEPITNAQPIPAPGPSIPEAEPSSAPITVPSHAEPSAWITYQQPGCCEPIGGSGEIFEELYTRTGPIIPTHAGLGDHVTSGWEIQGGGRTLFFNPEGNRAWVIDLNLLYMYNNGRKGQVAFDFGPTPETVTHLHRTDVTLAFGRERYLAGTARSDGWKWRVGYDGGICYGTTRVDVNDAVGNFNRLNSWNYGPEVAVHTDWERQCGCCLWTFGLRAEWDETFNNKLETTGALPHSIMDVSILLTLGARF